jgi:hypothetical protein
MKSHVAALLGLTAMFSPWRVAAQGSLDHLTCFKVSIAEPKTNSRVTLGTQAGSQTCTLKAPAKVACLMTTGTQVTPTPPGGGPAATPDNLLCYPLKCPRPAQGRATLADAFGQHTAAFVMPRLLCAPAAVVSGGITPTTTLPPTGCRFANGRCTGSCGAGKRCGAAVGTGSCECRSASCGDASAPECNGACSDPSEACIFSVTGCSCVRVP